MGEPEFEAPSLVGPGIYEGVPFEEYAAWPFFSGGFLRKMHEFSPAHAMAELEEPKDSATLREGSACHCALIEPGEFERRYALRPGGVRSNSNAYKDWEAAACANGALPLTTVQWDTALRVADAVRAHPYLKDVFGPGLDTVREVSVVWDEDSEVCKSLDIAPPRCKGRPDFWVEEINTMFDLKTCRDARSRPFNDQVTSLGYYWKAEWYMQGWEKAGRTRPDRFILIAAEKEKPWGVRPYVVNPDDLKAAQVEKASMLWTLYACIKNGEWPCYPPGLESTGLPQWKLKQIYERGI